MTVCTGTEAGKPARNMAMRTCGRVQDCVSPRLPACGAPQTGCTHSIIGTLRSAVQARVGTWQHSIPVELIFFSTSPPRWRAGWRGPSRCRSTRHPRPGIGMKEWFGRCARQQLQQQQKQQRRRRRRRRQQRQQQQRRQQRRRRRWQTSVSSATQAATAAAAAAAN